MIAVLVLAAGILLPIVVTALFYPVLLRAARRRQRRIWEERHPGISWDEWVKR